MQPNDNKTITAFDFQVGLTIRASGIWIENQERGGMISGET